MRLASKGSQVQCDHRRPLSEQSCAKKPLQLYTNTLPWDICPATVCSASEQHHPWCWSCGQELLFQNVLCKPPHLGSKNFPWPSPLCSWSPSTMAHRFLQQCSGVPNKYHSPSETLSVTWIDRIITNVLLCFKVFCWNISILSWNQEKC